MLHALQDLGSHEGVYFHLFEFFRSELAGFRDDMFRYCEFADVMQKRRGTKRIQVPAGQSHFHTQCFGIYADAL